jgi:ribosome biogenesis protein ENP2
MVYDARSGELLIASARSQCLRFSLDRGQFLSPFMLQSATASNADVNAVRLAPRHGLIGMCSGGGNVEFWDPRARKQLGGISFRPESTNNQDSVVSASALHWAEDGVHWMCGMEDGRVMLFDLRSDRPLSVGDHHNGSPILKMQSAVRPDGTNVLLSADKRSVKLWSLSNGGEAFIFEQNSVSEDFTSTNNGTMMRLFTTIESSDRDLNDFCVQSGSGLVMTANEGSPMGAYFLPALGPAPKWC